MKLLLIKLTILVTIVGFSVYLILSYLPNGYKDNYYIRFASPKAGSLIIGTSRAAQGLQPQIFEKEPQSKNYSFPMFNYAFTLTSSPYGRTYNKSILRKIKFDPLNKGLFILTVDPWSISMSNKKDSLVEDNSFMAKMSFVNLSPNPQYFFKCFKPLYNLFLSGDKSVYLHKNGWLETFADTSFDIIKKRTSEKILNYKQTMKESSLSIFRLSSLIGLIDTLKRHGDVFLVRLPIGKEMFELENDYMPSFNLIISKIAKKQKVNYLDYTDRNSEFLTLDGNHLHKTSGEKISKLVAHDIFKNKSNE